MDSDVQKVLITAVSSLILQILGGYWSYKRDQKRQVQYAIVSDRIETAHVEAKRAATTNANAIKENTELTKEGTMAAQRAYSEANNANNKLEAVLGAGVVGRPPKDGA